MRVDGARGKLHDAHKTLKAQWEFVQMVWNDQNKKEFEEKIYIPLDQLTNELGRAIDQLAQLFIEVRNQSQGERY